MASIASRPSPRRKAVIDLGMGQNLRPGGPDGLDWLGLFLVLTMDLSLTQFWLIDTRSNLQKASININMNININH